MATSYSSSGNSSVSEFKANIEKRIKQAEKYFAPAYLEEDRELFEEISKDKKVSVMYFLKHFTFTLIIFSTIWSMGQKLPEKKQKAFMPNVCKNSVSVEYAGNSATITLDKLDDVKPGDRIRILDNDKKQPFEVEISSVRGNYFTVEGLSKAKYGDKVFVYGKEVNDFRTIDYDEVSMMNFSATKKLTKQVEDQKLQIVALQDEISNLNNTVNKLMKLVQDQNSMIAKLETGLNAITSNTSAKIGSVGTSADDGKQKFIPNVYQKAISVTYNNEDAVITLPKLDDIKPGDKIKLYNEKNESYETTVATVNGNCLTIENVSKEMFGNEVFVYGKLVTFYRSEGL